MLKPTKIILHHSLTPDQKVADWPAITRYHMSYAYRGHIITMERALELEQERKTFKKPWSDNGYHFGIDRIGNTYSCFVGRTLDRYGAHCLGQNQKSIGICFVGNFNYQGPPPEQWALGIKIVKWILINYGLSPNDVYGHRNFSPKTCPGRMFDLGKFRSML